MESGSVSRAIKLAFAFGLIGAGVFFATSARAQTIVDDWANIKVPPAPELKSVKVDTGSTALVVLDIVKQICSPRPRCVASLPRIQKLLGQARDKGMLVVYTLAGQPLTDVLPEVTPRAEEPSVSSGPDKFLNTNLDQILKDMRSGDYEHLIKVFDDNFGTYIDLIRQPQEAEA